MEAGIELLNAVCARDLEGIVAKLANAPYTPAATTWVKIKNAAYSQSEGRADFFEGRGAANAPDGGIRVPGRKSAQRDTATSKANRSSRAASSYR